MIKSTFTLGVALALVTGLVGCGSAEEKQSERAASELNAEGIDVPETEEDILGLSQAEQERRVSVADYWGWQFTEIYRRDTRKRPISYHDINVFTRHTLTLRRSFGNISKNEKLTDGQRRIALRAYYKFGKLYRFGKRCKATLSLGNQSCDPL
jgi:hypothetical protein